MPYDEVSYRRLEDLEDLGEKTLEDLGEKTLEDLGEKKTKRNNNISLVICLSISMVMIGFIFGGIN